jgi:Subtilase family
VPDQLDHIFIQRLQESEIRRPVRNPFGASAPLRPDRRAHQRAVAAQIQAAIQGYNPHEVSKGVEGSNLLVLEMSFIGIDERQLLEDKFQASIVSESSPENLISEPRHEISLHFSNSEAAEKFIQQTQLQRWGERGLSITPERANLGSPSNTKFVLSSTEKTNLSCVLDTDFVKGFAGLDIEKANTSKIRASKQNLYKLIVQFSSIENQEQFLIEAGLYSSGNMRNSLLTAIQRASLFDALEDVHRISPDDKIGPRLRQSFDSLNDEPFFFDVDLWYPGEAVNLALYKQSFRESVQSLGGRVPGGPQEIAKSLLVAKLYGDKQVLSKVIDLEMVSWVDLPPQIDFDLFEGLANAVVPPDLTKTSLEDLPMAAVIDSGVVSAHPFLAGLVIDAIDFRSGEGTPADLNGHGTQVAGVVVYGDLTENLSNGHWQPHVRIISGKVLRNDQSGFGNGAVFAEDQRASTQISNAIRHINAEYGCRVFNISINENTRLYNGGRQAEWALMLDELARELNVVIVVSAGNAFPDVPSAQSRAGLATALLAHQATEKHAIADPASGANVLTVGSIARRDTPHIIQYLNQTEPSPIVPVSPNMPSPFTRIGHLSDKGSGLVKQLKPELVSYGGNHSLSSRVGMQPRWNHNDRNLTEVLLNHNYQSGQLLVTGWGTSFAAPYVTHICARVEHQLTNLLRGSGKIPSANLIRAVTVHSASVPSTTHSALSQGNEGSKGYRLARRFVGYGRPSIEKALFSENNRVLLIADDSIISGKFHIYEIELPENFVRNSGRRKIKATLAFDPPVRNTRKAYVAKTIWMNMCRGLTIADIERIRSTSGSGKTSFDSNQIIKMTPGPEMLSWSTVQSNIFETNRVQIFESCKYDDGKYRVHLIVGCESEFPGYDDELQRYGLVVSLEHEDAQISLYQEVQTKLVNRQRVRMREQSRIRT